jgi:hypothetical protein
MAGKTLLNSQSFSKTPTGKAQDALAGSVASSDWHYGGSQIEGFQTNHQMMRRHPALFTTRHEVDVMISQFTSHDSTVGNAIGRNCKDMQWMVMYDLDKAPISISLHVQEHKLHYNEVRIECNGKPIFQGAGSQTKGRMIEDFYYEWPLCGAIRGMNETNYFELRAFGCGYGTWFPATIIGQHEDGFFEVVAQQPDAYGHLRNVTYPAVDKADLREAASGSPLMIPESSLWLHVPRQDPLKAVLSVKGEAVTHHFGRPSPAVSAQTKETPKIQFRVSQDRSTVKSNVGPYALSQYVSGDVCSVNTEVQRLMHSWTFRCGPFAQHSVKLVKNYTLGKIVTLLVDDEVFVESSAADIGCQDHAWQCNFRFVGEKVLDFEVFKTNKDGFALNETDHVEERRKYMHECSVIIPNSHDLTSAQFFIDDREFRALPVTPPSFHQEPGLCMAPRAMLHSYGITVPYKVDTTAPGVLANMTSHLVARLPSLEDAKKQDSFFWMLSRCLDSGSTAEVVEIVPSQEETEALQIDDSKLSPTETYI